jgi:protease II
MGLIFSVTMSVNFWTFNTVYRWTLWGGSNTIMPAGVNKPKHKPSVESTVGKIATAIIAKLRNKTFYSLEELKLAVSQELKRFNDAPFQKREGSRTQVFNEMEKQYLRELPSIPYEVAEWVYGHTVKANLTRPKADGVA